jgi:5,10-methenyltetrahydrofolate synthetase
MAAQISRADKAARLPEVAAASCLACYVALPGEPDPAQLVTQLAPETLLVYPRLRPDGDLDFVRPASAAFAPGLRGTREPADGEVIPPSEIDVYVVPALAADAAGRRLGRGGGAYDRALARGRAVRPDAFIVALLHDDEVVPEVPAEPHDQLVHVLVTENRVVRTAAAPGERAQIEDRRG